MKSALNVSDKIRTRDLLVRSQTLYPAELHTHSYFYDRYNCVAITTTVILPQYHVNVKHFLRNFKLHRAMVGALDICKDLSVFQPVLKLFGYYKIVYTPACIPLS